MPDLEFQVSSLQGVLELHDDHLHAEHLRIVNDPSDPADRIFLKVLSSSSALTTEWMSFLELVGIEAELIVLLESDTHIHNGNFEGFTRVLFSDNKVISQTATEVILDDSSSYNTSLTIDKFKTKAGFVFCNQLHLLKGGQIQEVLGLKLHGPSPTVTVSGSQIKPGKIEYLQLGNLDIRSPIDQLSLDKVSVSEKFVHDAKYHVKTLKMQDVTTSANTMLSVAGVGTADCFALDTRSLYSSVLAKGITISKLCAPEGKVYIGASSYIDFRTGSSKELVGIELVLDMSHSAHQNKKIEFGSPFNFSRIIINGADDICAPRGGSVRELITRNCAKVTISRLTAETMRCTSEKPAAVSINGHVINDLLLEGEITATFGDIKTQNLEAQGLCTINFLGDVDITGTPTAPGTLKLNLDLDTANKDGKILSSQSAFRIGNQAGKTVKIDTFLAKLSTLHIHGNAQLGTVIVIPIDKLPTLLWVEPCSGSILKLGRLFVGAGYDLQVNKYTGDISVIKTDKMLSGGQVYASVSNASAKDYFFVKSGYGVKFDGKLDVVEGDIGLFTKWGNLLVTGNLKASGTIALASEHGPVSATSASLEAKMVSVYSSTETYMEKVILNAQHMVAQTLGQYLEFDSSFKAGSIAIVANGAHISKSTTNANALVIASRKGVVMTDSNTKASSIFVRTVEDFLLAGSKIDIASYPNVLFASQQSEVSLAPQAGYMIATDVTLVGIVSSDRGSLIPTLSWKTVDTGKIALTPGVAYIDGHRGTIVGSEISADNSVILKLQESVIIVPLVLYNALTYSGGFNTAGIKEVITRINTGTLQIEAGKSAIFIGAILKAAEGIIDSEIVYLLASPKEIEAQQTRMKELRPWRNELDIGKYFNFSETTSIRQKTGNLTHKDDFSSPNLSFTYRAGAGDVVFDESWKSKYDKFVLNLEGNKLLITSRGLQNIYQAGGDTAAARTVIGGHHVCLIADEVTVEGAKINVSGDLKIVTRDGVHILPIAVHKRLEYHYGSKDQNIEVSVRQVISEINAGYFNIQAGGTLDLISALIKATGVKIEASKLHIGAAKEVFEKHVYFRGAEKWYGGRQEWEEHVRSEVVIPTIIQAGSVFANIRHDTTIEAANILVEDSSTIKTGGNLNILHQYNVHVYDHVSKKTTIFAWKDGLPQVNCTKSVKEHFYGEEIAPTIYYSRGSFFGIADGHIHMLGAKIVGNDIYLVGKKGVRLEAAPYHQEQFVSITETGIRSGVNFKSGEVSVGAELFKDMSKSQVRHRSYEATEVIARGKLVIEADKDTATVEIISSKIRFETAHITAKDLVIKTHKALTQQTVEQTGMSVGIKMGVEESITPAINRAGYLLNKEGTHWLDVLDRALNGYQLYKDAGTIAGDVGELAKPGGVSKLSSIKYGIWANANLSTTRSDSTAAAAVDNIVRGGDIAIILSGHALIEGIHAEVTDFTLKAHSAEIRASSDQRSMESQNIEISLSIPITGNIPPNASTGGQDSGRSATIYHDNNRIYAKGKLVLDLDVDGKISGVKLQGAQVSVRAQNLVVESLQDIIEERMRGMSVSVGFSGKEVDSLGVNIQSGKRDVAWTNAVGSIIGTEVVKVVVQQTLEIAGGLITNAEVDRSGHLTDKGKLSVKAGSIVAKHLHDYDNGASFGIGVSLSKALDDKGNAKWGIGSIPVSCSFNERSRDILPIIGQGTTHVDQVFGSLTKDLASHIGPEEAEKASLKATVPVRDIVNFIQKSIKASENKIPQGVAAGDLAEDYKAPAEYKEEEKESVHQSIERDKTLLILSDAAYMQTLEEIEAEAKAAGFDMIIPSSTAPTKPGYFAVALINSKTQEIVMAHRGSDFDGWEERDPLDAISGRMQDLNGVFSIGLGNVPTQFAEAEIFYSSIKAQFPNYNITQTGHSSGGLYAKGLGFKYGHYTAGFDSPGDTIFLDNGILTQQDVGKNKHLITAYNSFPNFINTSGGPQLAGKIVRINVQGCTTNPFLVNPISYGADSICLHRSKNLIKHFNDQTLVTTWTTEGYSHHEQSAEKAQQDVVWNAHASITKHLQPQEQAEVKEKFMQWLKDTSDMQPKVVEEKLREIISRVELPEYPKNLDGTSLTTQ